ncbi:MAG: glycerol acyltransferase [Aureispira sp.]|nr:glycerol acyltransferase [Aureispira sp.]
MADHSSQKPEKKKKSKSSRNITSRKPKVYTQEDIENNKFIYDEHFRLEFVRAINEAFFDVIVDSYFRPQFIGFDEMPERNDPDHPVILASNHSGMAFPWDAMIFGCSMFKRFDYDPNKMFRVIVSPMLSNTPMMHPFFFKHAWKMAGGIDANFLNFETMMEYPDGHLLIYPEGVPGIGKGFNRKYELQRFATSFIRMSLKHRVDILPYATVNAEYVAPLMYSFEPLNKLVNKIGMPFLPIGPLTLFLIFPFAFYLAFPANMHFVKGTRVRPYEWTDKPYEEMTEEEIRAIRDRVKEHMQKELDEAVAEYGKAPYKMGNLLKSLGKSIKHFPYNTPLGWGFAFHEFERQWHKHGKDGKPVKIYTGWGAIFNFMFRNPITLAYFIPILGWVILYFYGKMKWKKD